MLILHACAPFVQASGLPFLLNSRHSHCFASFPTIKLRLRTYAQFKASPFAPKMEERLRRKRNKILHTKTGSATPMKVTFNKFNFSNSYIWFEFYNAPLEKDVSLLCDSIRAWHIVGRLGGCNSMNMQLSQSPLEKRPSYDAIQGANVTPTTFYNIGDLEIQQNLARIWVDIGTGESLILDLLINALTQISSDFVGIKQVVFGGSEFENWKENMTSEDAGFSVHKI
uniref:Uncharacterized protein n=1 Tax=Cannabis sativa TaxID=3483 RepID=A0A803QJT9_CANSA